MAVTIISSPELYTPSDNPVVWVFSSDQFSQANFSYVVEIYVNGNLSSVREVFPEVGARAHIDIQEETRIKTPVTQIGQSNVIADAANYSRFLIIIKERYGTTPAYHATVTSASIYCFKAALSPEDRQAFSYVLHTPVNADSKFMTSNNNDLYIAQGNDYFLSIITNLQAGLSLVIYAIRADGTQVTAFDLLISTPARINKFRLNTEVIMDDTGMTQLQIDETAYFDVRLEDNGGLPKSETKKIYIQREDCGTPAHLVWLNALGGFDCFTFLHNRIYSGAISKNSYSRQFGQWQGTSYVLDAASSGRIDYRKSLVKKMRAVSGYINENEQNYIVSSLLVSPLVYLDSSPVLVDTAEYEFQQDIFEDEFTQVIDITFPNAQESVIL